MKVVFKGLVFICLGLISCNECEFKNQIFLKDYSGIVVEKKKYQWGHGTKVIFIKCGEEVEKYYFPADFIYEKLWKQIEIGDSILKVKDEFIFSIYRSNEKIASMEVKFNCQ